MLLRLLLRTAAASTLVLCQRWAASLRRMRQAPGACTGAAWFTPREMRSITPAEAPIAQLRSDLASDRAELAGCDTLAKRAPCEYGRAQAVRHATSVVVCSQERTLRRVHRYQR